MAIVAGHITVDPAQRESYLAGSVSVVDNAPRQPAASTSRSAPDLVDPGRVNLFEVGGHKRPSKLPWTHLAQQARCSNALSVASRVPHRRRAALVQKLRA